MRHEFAPLLFILGCDPAPPPDVEPGGEEVVQPRLAETWSVELSAKALVAETTVDGEALVLTEDDRLYRLGPNGRILDERTIDLAIPQIGLGPDGQAAMVGRDASGEVHIHVLGRPSGPSLQWTVDGVLGEHAPAWPPSEFDGVAIDAFGDIWLGADGVLLALDRNGTAQVIDTGMNAKIVDVFGGNGVVYAVAVDREGWGWVWRNDSGAAVEVGFTAEFGRAGPEGFFIGGQLDGGPCYWIEPTDMMIDVGKGYPKDCGYDHGATHVGTSLRIDIYAYEPLEYPLAQGSIIRSYTAGAVLVSDGATLKKLEF